MRLAPGGGASATSYLRAIALYHGWEFLGGDNLKGASEAAILSLATPKDTHAQLAAVMLLLSSAAQEYARSHKTTPDKHEVIRIFDFLDRTLPPSYEGIFRLHLRTVIYWSSERGRPLTHLLPECWGVLASKTNGLQHVSTHVRDDAFLLLTANTFRFRKIGPGAGIYQSLTHTNLQWELPTIEGSDVAPQIKICL